MQAKAKPEAQLGDRQSESVEPRRVGCGKSPPNPSSIRLNLFNLLSPLDPLSLLSPLSPLGPLGPLGLLGL